MRNGIQGFTLIELLIVMGIMGILSAMLIPNLLSARSRAYDAITQACAKEVQTKQEIYNIDNKQYATAAQLWASADYTPKCDAQIANADGSAATGATFAFTMTPAVAPFTSYSVNVKHPQGKKTWIVSQYSLTGS